ncbi:extracellular solute-binding protein [Pseudarthrobacter sp. AL07]|uniref:ABC transporter substrate-binding protein n=1 Tax=unclassified Pseudarthrobacter TaxID=2647000 RepID=UPI00249C9C99|nr:MULTISPECIES: extracellular solute-binding protein [unclassified Pseudarthrobacter]MDI3195637.1 extracellular solute-binding protein [Pseudarthrobacter sp. AL20]MDI3209753.1 extracellular solute-binding protein [Pseudarthrobacter sp. AL07]
MNFPKRIGRSPLLLAVAALTVASLAACGAGSQIPGATGAKGTCLAPEPASPVTVNVLAYGAPGMDPFTKAMTSACNGVKNLKVNHSPVDFSAQLEKAPLSLSQPADGASYDIVEVYNTTLVEYASKGWLAPLDEWVAKNGEASGVNDIDPALLEKMKYDGHLYALPNQQNVHILMYRKDILDSLGIQAPTTYDELYAAADKIKTAGKSETPFVASFNADSDISTAFNNALTSQGGSWVNGGGQPTLASPEGAAAINDLRKLKSYMSSDALTLNNAKAVAALQNGQAAMGIIYAGRGATLIDPALSKFSNDFAFAPAPAAKPGGKPAAQWTQDGFAIAKNSKVGFETLAGVLATSVGDAAMTNGAPFAVISRASKLNDPALQAKAPYWQAALDTLKAGADTLPLKPFMPTIQQSTRPFIVEAVNGTGDPMDALVKADAAANAALTTAGYLK